MFLVVLQFKNEKEQKEKDLIHAGVDFDACGASALQKMAGEDPGKATRVDKQRQQVYYQYS